MFISSETENKISSVVLKCSIVLGLVAGVLVGFNAGGVGGAIFGVIVGAISGGIAGWILCLLLWCLNEFLEFMLETGIPLLKVILIVAFVIWLITCLWGVGK